jgi:hypothetical protein
LLFELGRVESEFEGLAGLDLGDRAVADQELVEAGDVVELPRPVGGRAVCPGAVGGALEGDGQDLLPLGQGGPVSQSLSAPVVSVEVAPMGAKGASQ